MNRRSRQRGVALITALLVVALATIAAVAMTRDQGLAVRRAENLRNAEQAWQYALGLEAFARKRLHEDLARGDRKDTRNEPWASPLPPLPVDNGQLTGRLEDLDGRFNVNTLLGSAGPGIQAERFRRLLEVLGLDPAVAPALADWLDPDIEARADGAEDYRYTGMSPGYRAGNRALVHPSELRLVLGVDANAWERLEPHVTALPSTDTAINVNTATEAVLRSLAEGISAEEARSLARAGRSGFASVDEFLDSEPLADLEVERSGLGVESRYFKSLGVVQLGDDVFRFHSLIRRMPRGGMPVLMRWRGSR